MGKRREREGPPLVRKFLDPPLCRTRFVIVSFVACRTQNAVGFFCLFRNSVRALQFAGYASSCATKMMCAAVAWDSRSSLLCCIVRVAC